MLYKTLHNSCILTWLGKSTWKKKNIQNLVHQWKNIDAQLLTFLQDLIFLLYYIIYIINWISSWKSPQCNVPKGSTISFTTEQIFYMLSFYLDEPPTGSYMLLRDQVENTKETTERTTINIEYSSNKITLEDWMSNEKLTLEQIFL